MNAGIKDWAWLATGIGSLPHREPDRALDLIEATLPEVPHWPQLPARSKREGFARQYLGCLLDTRVIELKGDRVLFDPGADTWPDALAGFYDRYLLAEERGELEPFGFDADAAAGFTEFTRRFSGRSPAYVKGQASGPLTVGFTVTDSELRAGWYHQQFRDALVKSLAAHVRWQAGKLAQIGKRVVMFIDEPGLYMYGQSAFVALGREEIVQALSELLDAARAAGAITGVHVCAGCDWSLVLAAGADIVSFDAGSFLVSLLPYGQEIQAHLASGGLLAWGLVPTTDEAAVVTARDLVQRYDDGVAALAARGVDAYLVRSRSLITPACGTGTLEPVVAERIYHLTREVQDLMRTNSYR